MTDTANAIKSAIGPANRIPLMPKNKGRIRISGIRKKTCLVNDNQKSFQSFADRREEIGRQKLNTVDNGHEQEDAHE